MQAIARVEPKLVPLYFHAHHLNIDADVLEAAKALARHHRRSVGAVISELARQALTAPPHTRSRQGAQGVDWRLPARGGVATNEDRSAA